MSKNIVHIQFVGKLSLGFLRQEGAHEPGHVGLQSKQYPVSWLKAHDALSALGEGADAFLSYAEVARLVTTMRPRAVEKERVDELLQLLNDLGVLVWFNGWLRRVPSGVPPETRPVVPVLHLSLHILLLLLIPL